MGDMTATDNYRVLLSGGEGEIVEKKSRFISTIRKCETEEEAVAFIEEMKKKYWDARHNCSAFIIGSRGELTRCSDDGEPSGTAGRPMLEVLTGSGIRNIAVVVTRYFGGTLLGTGGLVRAYQDSVRENLSTLALAEQVPLAHLDLTLEYAHLDGLRRLLPTFEARITDEDYQATAGLGVSLPEEHLAAFLKAVAGMSNGAAVCRVREDG